MLHRKALTLKQLRALAAIVDAGSVTAAAGVLHVTPPAVSTQLRALEDIVGAQVLLRGPNGKIALVCWMKHDDIGVAMLDLAGDLDKSFSGNGKRIVQIRSDTLANPHARAVLIDYRGRIVVGGNVMRNGSVVCESLLL